MPQLWPFHMSLKIMLVMRCGYKSHRHGFQKKKKDVKKKGYREQTVYTKLRLKHLQTMFDMAVTYSFFPHHTIENAQTSSSISYLSKLLRKYPSSPF
jgi:hypothetical protein